MKTYKLEGRTPVEAEDDDDSSCFLARPLKRTTVGQVVVSTAFLGIDHGFGRGGPPVLFETMVFGGELDGRQHRSCTMDEAEEQHQLAVLCVVELARRRHQWVIDRTALRALMVWIALTIAFL